MTTNTLLTIEDVTYRTTLSRTAVTEAIEQGDFPQPMRLPQGQPVWYEADIDAWIDSRPLADDLPERAPCIKH